LQIQGSSAQMIVALPYRGWDATGVNVIEAAGFAHARLSIIDVQGGASPYPVWTCGFPFSTNVWSSSERKLPARPKMKVLNEKYLLKLSCDGLVLESIRRRPKRSLSCTGRQMLFYENAPPMYKTLYRRPRSKRLESSTSARLVC
jgi:hypothetical protein